MNPAALARALCARRLGSGWMARCPAHDDREPSLSVREGEDGRVLVRCHAGCDQRRVIEALRSRGLWESAGRRGQRSVGRVPYTAAEKEHWDRYAVRAQAALGIWQSATPADGTLVETYLVSRGLRLQPPWTLRFHAGLRHPSGGIWPAMVALVTRGADDRPLAIHRTFLARDGNGKAPVNPAKMMIGPCRGGAVRFAPPDDLLMVGEGIETCLAVMQATGKPTWAALSTSGLRALDLPLTVRDVTILADGDEAGEAAADDAAQRWNAGGARCQRCAPATRP